MLKIKNININYDASTKNKDEVFLSDNKLAFRFLDKDSILYCCLYDFNEVQDIINNMDLEKQYPSINPIIDDEEGDMISHITISKDKDIEVELGVYVDDPDREYIINCIPDDMFFDETHIINLRSNDFNKPLKFI